LQEFSQALESENGLLREKLQLLDTTVATLERDAKAKERQYRHNIERLEEELTSAQQALEKADKRGQQQSAIVQELQDQIMANASAKDLDSELAYCRVRLAELEVGCSNRCHSATAPRHHSNPAASHPCSGFQAVVSSLQLERVDLQSTILGLERGTCIPKPWMAILAAASALFAPPPSHLCSARRYP
jgi:hypothetical protein